MRWDKFFDDLAGQASSAMGAELLGEVEERSRDEVGRLSLATRLAGSSAHPLTVDLVDGASVTGRPLDVGDGWLCLASAADEVIVPLPALAGIRWATRVSGAADGSPGASGFGLRPVLRALVRRRVYVRLSTRGGSTAGGTLEGVGADHVELAEHPADRPRRADEVRAFRLVPFDALLTVRYASD